MAAKQCDGALSPTEIQAEELGTELRLYTCTTCGQRNLYSIKDSGKWALEPHYAPAPRLQFQDPAN
jgi:hypothetical protein